MSKNKLTPDRIAVLEKIKEYEAKGGEYFFCDVEEDPPCRTLMPEDVDYLHDSLRFKVNGFFCRGAEQLLKLYFKKKLCITVSGAENIKNLTGGAIFTSNHFSATENLAVKLAAERAPGRHRLYKLVREGNYFMPGMIGWLLKYCDTLPLSSSPETLKLLNKAVNKILQRGDFILIYPEQAMWWNYRKPRPYRIGAFYYAAKNNVPVVPCFVSLHRKDPKESLLPDNVRYEMHILKPVYPDKALTVRENAARMMQKNAEQCKEAYEKAYGRSLSYTDNSTAP